MINLRIRSLAGPVRRYIFSMNEDANDVIMRNVLHKQELSHYGRSRRIHKVNNLIDLNGGSKAVVFLDESIKSHTVTVTFLFRCWSCS